MGGVGRLMEVLAASLAILATLPLMVLIAVLVRLTSPGPVLVEERRVGLDRRTPDRRDRRRQRGPAVDPAGRRRRGERRSLDRGGRLFRIFSFRTTYVGAEHGETPRAPGSGTPTPVGRVLRSLRLDELPRLFSVVRGDMTLSRPRPGLRPTAPVGWDEP